MKRSTLRAIKIVAYPALLITGSLSFYLFVHDLAASYGITIPPLITSLSDIAIVTFLGIPVYLQIRSLFLSSLTSA